MHYRLVIKVIATLLLIVAFFMVFPIAFALYYRELSLLPSFLIPMAITTGVSVLALLCCRNPPGSITTRDGFLLVSFVL